MKRSWTKPWTWHFEPGMGLVDDTPGMSFNPFDTGFILGRLGFLFGFFIVLPLFVAFLITVLQWVFPWWPR